MRHNLRVMLTLCVFLLLWSPACPAHTRVPEMEATGATPHRVFAPDSGKLARTIMLLARSGSYKEAERQITRLLREQPVSPDGYRVLELVYLQLATIDMPELWDAWCTASPDAAIPLTIRGLHFLQKARQIDRNSGVGTVSRQQREAVTLLSKARADLETAAGRDSGDPAPAAAMAELVLQTDAPSNDLEQWYARSIAADPAWMAAYQAKLRYLAPWHHGSKEKMLLFADQCLNQAPPGSIVYTVALDYLQLNKDRQTDAPGGDLFMLAPDHYAMAVKAIRHYRSDYPEGGLLGLYLPLLDVVERHPYEAIAAFSARLAENGSDISALTGRSSAYLASGQYQLAEQDLQTMLAIEPASPESFARLGRIYFEAYHDPDRGGALFEQALRNTDSPSYTAELLVQRGRLLHQRNRNLAAIADFDRAISLAPYRGDAYLARAESRFSNGDRSNAITDLLMITSTIKGPHAEEARALLDIYLLPAPQTNDVAEVSTPAGEPDSRPSAPPPAATGSTHRNDTETIQFRDALIEGTQHYYNRSYNQARQAWQRAISIHPDDPRPHFLLGQMAETITENMDEALTAYLRAAACAPDNPSYKIAAARLKLQQKDPEAAAAMLTPLLLIHPTAEAFFLRGRSFLELGRTADAIKDMALVPAGDPRYPEAQAYITKHAATNKQTLQTRPPTVSDKAPGTAARTFSTSQAKPPDLPKPDRQTDLRQLLDQADKHVRAENLRQAKLLLFQCVQDFSHHGEPYYRLGLLFAEREHDNHKALVYLTLAIERAPDNPDYLRQRGIVHYRQGDCDAAVADFDKVLAIRPDDQTGRVYRDRCLTKQQGIPQIAVGRAGSS